MKRRGRPFMAGIFGFLAGVFAMVTLLAFGVVPLDSILVTTIPIATLVVGFALAMWSPIGKAEPPPPPVAPDRTGTSI